MQSNMEVSTLAPFVAQALEAAEVPVQGATPEEAATSADLALVGALSGFGGFVLGSLVTAVLAWLAASKASSQAAAAARASKMSPI